MVENIAAQSGDVDLLSQDATARQFDASTPENNVWVGASAGTGKTKVLTDRVLRLLLPRENGAAASPAHKILCLTFTKAGASEMSIRIASELGSWAVMDDLKLHERLKALYGRTAKEHEIKAARELFADVVDVPGGLKIMTIHSFCQSVLGRFPLEAGVSPQFRLIEEQDAANLIEQARRAVMSGGADDDDIRSAVHNVASFVNDEQFSSLLEGFISEREQFFKVLDRIGGVNGVYQELCRCHDISANESSDDILHKACMEGAFARDELKKIYLAKLDLGTANEVKDAAPLEAFLSAVTIEERMQLFETSYQNVFLTSGEIRKRLVTSNVAKSFPDAVDIMRLEAERIVAILEKIAAHRLCSLTRDLCLLCEKILFQYQSLKEIGGYLDYDDLIQKTAALLKGQREGFSCADSSWVQYKLDQGIDHVLVDEAQDTNPIQWDVISALCGEFFTGEGAQEQDRSLFVVGDEKQSIYSFQRASPVAFNEMKAFFKARVEEAQKKWSPVAMNTSFRSTYSVLSVVDSVFADVVARVGLGEDKVAHTAFRRGHAGLVELLPLYHFDESDEKLGLWDVPDEALNLQTAQQKMADALAQKVKGWLDNQDILLSKDRPVEAGDIMILLGRRGELINQISKALKKQGVPVGGVDRIVLGDELAVEDLMAAARFALLPEDDLNLACFLKSPFIGLNEDELFHVAYGREGSLWDVARKALPQAHISYMKEMIKVGRNEKPYEFFAYMLHSQCPADDVSGLRALLTRLGSDVKDALDEFMSAALSFGMNDVASLQQFVFEQERGASEIKREQEEGGGFVRIMTVHGSKGLQAPIVILPDTTQKPRGSGGVKANQKLLWPDKTGVSIPLWAANKDVETEFYKDHKVKIDDVLEEEKRRLLYVAMTRAEDRLYVMGAAPKKKPKDRDVPENCWYELVQKGMLAHPEVQDLGDGHLIVQHKQLAKVKGDTQKELQMLAKVSAVPQWAYESVEELNEPLIDIIRPSQMAEVASSPISGTDERRFARGNLIHKLLQVLPDIPRQRWNEAGGAYLKRYADGFSEKQCEEILNNSLRVLNDEAFKDIFGPGSRSEVPINGLVQGQGFVNGQIDRLLVQEDKVLFIDYKTNRPPPHDVENVPEIYKKQMSIYAEILRQIYPDKAISGALLWTDGPFLMKI